MGHYAYMSAELERVTIQRNLLIEKYNDASRMDKSKGYILEEQAKIFDETVGWAKKAMVESTRNIALSINEMSAFIERVGSEKEARIWYDTMKNVHSDSQYQEALEKVSKRIKLIDRFKESVDPSILMLEDNIYKVADYWKDMVRDAPSAEEAAKIVERFNMIREVVVKTFTAVWGEGEMKQ